MSRVIRVLLEGRGEDVAGEVSLNNSPMAVEDAGVTLQQLEIRNHHVCNIPFEFVDDDELAAIETAMLQANSMSSAYHSIASLSTDISGNSNLSQNINVSAQVGRQPLTTNKPENAIVYCVSSPSSRAPNGLVSATIASGRNSTAQQGSSSSGFEDVSFSQSPEGMCTPSQEMLLYNYLASVSSVSDESSPPCHEADYLLFDTTNSSFARKSIVQGEISGDSQDIEDLCGANNARVSRDGGSSGSSVKQEAVIRTSVTLRQHKSGRGFSVTDFTASEWCEKQVEFSLNRGKPEQTPAMKAGSTRHVQLEEEVVTKAEIEIFTKEDTWAVRLLNFISGARQLLSEGLTREIPVVGLVGATWVVGIIDEIRLVQTEWGEQPLLLDTKTRKKRSPPSEPQKRNARLQLMCYKLLWDSMIKEGLPSELFFNHFRLNPEREFCQDVKAHAASFWVDCKVECLQDLLQQIMEDVGSQVYLESVDTLLLRYEWQEDNSLLGQDEFLYERDWLMDRWKWHSEFWNGHRAASYVPEDEAWKCSYCSFASACLPLQQSARKDMKDMEGSKEDVREDIEEVHDVVVPGLSTAS